MTSCTNVTTKCSWTRLCWLALVLLSTLLVETQAQGIVFGCPNQELTSTSTTLTRDDPQGKDFVEVSGVALSPTQKAPSGKPVMFAINDSGGGKRLGIYDSGNGKRLLTLKVSLFNSINDYESLAIGSCGGNRVKSTCLYIADVGDNPARGSKGERSGRGGKPYRIHKILEPLISHNSPSNGLQDNSELPGAYFVGTMNFLYSNGPKKYADCEAVFLDHTGWGERGAIGDLYLITKQGAADRELARVFKIPDNAWNQGQGRQFTHNPQVVGTAVDGGRDLSHAYTGAEMSWDGTLIGVGQTGFTYLFLRCPGMSVAEALSERACHSWDTPRSNEWSSVRQYEALSWKSEADGSQTLLQIAESRHKDPPLAWTRFRFGKGAKMCEQMQWTFVAPTFCPIDCVRVRNWQCTLTKTKVVVSGAICEAHGLTRPSPQRKSCIGGACPDAPITPLIPSPEHPSSLEQVPSKFPIEHPSPDRPSSKPSKRPTEFPSPKPSKLLTVRPSLVPEPSVAPSSPTNESLIPSPRPIMYIPAASKSGVSSSVLSPSLSAPTIAYPRRRWRTRRQPSSSQARSKEPLVWSLLGGLWIVGVVLL